MEANSTPLIEAKSGLFTPGRALVGILLLAGLYATFMRFSQGLGASTHMTDDFPWGIWIGFDVLCGAALAAGGFTITGLVYLFGYKPYESIIRPTVLTAFLGYNLLGVGLLYDVGRPWVMWHPLIYHNPHSVMFEVALCVMLYTFVLTAEFSPMVFERLGWHRLYHFVKGITIPLVVLGVLLSTLHQSSLGTLYLLMPGRLHALWYTPILPILFYASAITIAFAMVIFESCLSARYFKKSLEKPILVDLSRFLVVGLIVYMAIRFQDLARRGAGSLIWQPQIETLFFWLENGCLGAAAGMLLSRRVRAREKYIFIAASLAILGVILNRFNVSIIGHYRFTGVHYIPSVVEILVSVFLVTIGVVAFVLICKYLPVFSTAGGHGSSPTAGLPQTGLHREDRMDPKRWMGGLLLIVAFAAGLAVERYFLPKTGEATPVSETRVESAVTKAAPPSEGAPLSPDTKYHTVSNPPKEKIFLTDFNGGSIVRFNHETHEGVAECIQCHHVEACSKCHMKNQINVMQVEEGKIALHENCLQCHEQTQAADPKDCEFCHFNSKE